MDKGDYKDFCRLYTQAEKYLKRLERHAPRGGILIPAINELRYAGCHIKRSILAENHEGYLLHISSAERHCKRSICDSVSTIIDHSNASLYDIRTSYFFVPIGSYVENHASMMAEVGRAIEFVDEHTHDEDREAIELQETHTHEDQDCWPYENLIQTLERLLQIKDIYDAARPDLIRAARRYGATLAATITIGLLTVAAAIVFGVLQHTKKDSPPPPNRPQQSSPAVISKNGIN